MFYDGNASFAPSFIYPGSCMGAYFDKNLGTWREGSLSGYNVWDWIVAPFINEEFTPAEYCVINELQTGQSLGPNITSIFSANWPSQCPSPSHILATFAIVNVVVAFTSLVLGHQKVLHFLSCKLLGNEHPAPTSSQHAMQRVQLFLPLGLQLLANSIITLLTRAAPGYKDGFTFAQLFLFLAARPRTTWIFAAWGAGFASKKGTLAPGFPDHLRSQPLPELKRDIRSKQSYLGRDTRPALRAQESTYSLQNHRRGVGSWRDDRARSHGRGYAGRSSVPNRPLDGRHSVSYAEQNPVPKRPLERHEIEILTYEVERDNWTDESGEGWRRFYPYQRFARGQLVAEAVLLAIASYSIGSTARFASQSGFYDLISGASQVRYATYGPEHEYAAKMMYAGAIWWIVCFPVAFVLLVLISRVLIRYTSGLSQIGELFGWILRICSLILMASLYLGQWLWLVGFVNLMGPLYCPPNLATQASIWIGASVVGILFGAGF
ncbi:hypothetical protein BDZ45DRAFT_733776 [Acephala macrosclerotiorum]|nr:hypothetical protein BDZ45DRAFT_733776 [Acephala macrosclerotiorum]